jgi:hypothetical protein
VGLSEELCKGGTEKLPDSQKQYFSGPGQPLVASHRLTPICASFGLDALSGLTIRNSNRGRRATSTFYDPKEQPGWTL